MYIYLYIFYVHFSRGAQEVPHAIWEVLDPAVSDRAPSPPSAGLRYKEGKGTHVTRGDGLIMLPSRPPRSLALPPADGTFVAIDFETADHAPDSACAVGLVRVEALRVVHRENLLIRPPRRRFLWTHVHGITWEM